MRRTRQYRADLAKAIARQVGCSIKTVHRNRLTELPAELRQVYIGQIRAHLENIRTKTVAKKQRGSLRSLGMRSVYRRPA